MLEPPATPDTIGPVGVQVYRTTTDDDVELAVTRLDGGNRKPPVVLVHGTFCQRSFWMSQRGLGLGPYLAGRGYDVWIPELRGHGRSLKDRRFRRWSAEDHLRFDLPAVQRLVAAATGRRAAWVGHSWGGMAVVASLAVGWLDGAAIPSAVVLGANITEGDTWLRRSLPRAAAWVVLTLFGGVPAPWLGLGPEWESRGYLLDFYRWKGRVPRWVTADGRDYWEGVRAIEVPLLAFAAADDHNDPAPGCRALFDAVGSADKRFVLLGEAEGFSRDYQHLEMIISKAAAAEVWPRIADWLDRHRSAGADAGAET